MALRLTFLGTGTSFGVPVVGCDCSTCTSADTRDRRTRHGALVESDEGTLLVDAPPELRLQLLAADATRIDAVWFTHMHADHVHGIDDLRAFTVRGGEMPAWVPARYREQMMSRFDYIFDDAIQPPADSSKPRLAMNTFDDDDTVDVIGRSFQPVVVPHGNVDVYGFRVGGLGYVTDAKRLPPEALERLAGVDVLVLNALWFGKTHATHFNVEEAIEAAEVVGADRTYLTHLTHRVSHAELEARLPAGVYPAHDGLVVTVEP